MPRKTIHESPTISDSIVFDIECPNGIGAFIDHPHAIETLTISYVERDVSGLNYGAYEKASVPESMLAAIKKAQALAIESPTADNVTNLEILKAEADSIDFKSTFYYKSLVPIVTLGSKSRPVWSSTDYEQSPIQVVETDNEGNAIFGHFQFVWDLQGVVREGDYFISWAWKPFAASESLNKSIHFNVKADSSVVTSLPTHVTDPDKYETLLKMYLPTMYKTQIHEDDQTPFTLYKLNKATAEGFTFLEDMANQVVDLFDANVLHESMLRYLSNTLGVTLKSNDTTLWRRQIKEAVSLSKKKGTLAGLKASFEQTGMELEMFQQFWQVASQYTWTESFKVTNSADFELSKETIVWPDISTNFKVWHKSANETTYNEVTSEHVDIELDEQGKYILSWVGDQLTTPLYLKAGDRIKVRYQFKEIPGSPEQTIENYIQSLPLMDKRNEDDQTYPPINYNVHLITEDDPMFETIVTVRHPFYDPLVYGYVRTEFAYSENVYNAEEYNGSIRPSTNMCDIDKEFVDPCSACLSSDYKVIVKVNDLTDDRISEVRSILKENMPFHARPHSIAVSGKVHEYIKPPVEKVQVLITWRIHEPVLVSATNLFGRSTGSQEDAPLRNQLSTLTTVLSGKIGTAFNDYIEIFTPYENLQSLGVYDRRHELEILSPSANAGFYTINSIDGRTARLNGSISEPINQSEFSFRLTNYQYRSHFTSIVQKDLLYFSLENVNQYNIRSLWDVEHNPEYTGGPWKILASAYSASPVEIANVIDGKIVINWASGFPLANVLSGVTFKLLDNQENEIETFTNQSISITRRAHVIPSFVESDPLSDFVQPSDLLLYDGTEYLIESLEGNTFYILGYTDGDASGVSTDIRRRLVQDGVGYLIYRGMYLETFADHEAEFGMINGMNPPPEEDRTGVDNYKENYVFKINGEYYVILNINKKIVLLAGAHQDWKTLNAGGTTVAYSVHHFEQNPAEVDSYTFDGFNRSSRQLITLSLYNSDTEETQLSALSTGDGLKEVQKQKETVSFVIEYKDGRRHEGTI